MGLVLWSSVFLTFLERTCSFVEKIQALFSKLGIKFFYLSEVFFIH